MDEQRPECAHCGLLIHPIQVSFPRKREPCNAPSLQNRRLCEDADFTQSKNFLNTRKYHGVSSFNPGNPGSPFVGGLHTSKGIP